MKEAIIDSKALLCFLSFPKAAFPHSLILVIDPVTSVTFKSFPFQTFFRVLDDVFLKSRLTIYFTLYVFRDPSPVNPPGLL